MFVSLIKILLFVFVVVYVSRSAIFLKFSSIVKFFFLYMFFVFIVCCVIDVFVSVVCVNVCSVGVVLFKCFVRCFA